MADRVAVLLCICPNSSIRVHNTGREGSIITAMVSDGDSLDLQQPLLPERQPQPALQHSQQDTFWRCTFNLAKVITGAGMMAIPRAYAHIGSLTGTIMLVGVGFLTYFTLAVLVRGSAVTGAPTYTQLAHVTCGKFSAKVLQLAILAFCFGFGVVYLVSWLSSLSAPSHPRWSIMPVIAANAVDTMAWQQAATVDDNDAACDLAADLADKLHA
eukprot:GHRR01033702.1.p1 GENE.GHRR01033702.1~~GHRR01033702.1.p1  ORF type:complete len:213 (+),score=61.50 GHRR01033702.1:371-1009(+)